MRDAIVRGDPFRDLVSIQDKIVATVELPGIDPDDVEVPKVEKAKPKKTQIKAEA